jgi:hypothetical protein
VRNREREMGKKRKIEFIALQKGALVKNAPTYST